MKLLFELGVEELPHSGIAKGEEQLRKLFEQELKKRGISFRADNIETFSTPRRLAVIIAELPPQLRTEAKTIKGPKLESTLLQAETIKDPAQYRGFLQALGGFCKAHAPQLVERAADSAALLKLFPLPVWDDAQPAAAQRAGLYAKIFGGNHFVVVHRAGTQQSLIAVLPAVLQAVMTQLEFGETMRWHNSPELVKTEFAKYLTTGAGGDGAHPSSFPRPIRNITALLARDVIPFHWAGVASGRVTYGHRWLSESTDFNGTAITVPSSDDWEKLLVKHYVLPRRAERMQLIERGLKELAEQYGWEVLKLEQLLPVVTDLVEYPQLVIGDFSADFLKLPREVIISELVAHQKCFPLADREGNRNLVPEFIAVSNICKLPDGSEGSAEPCITSGAAVPPHVKTGNERVICARLSDGLFFYEQDKKTGIAAMAEKLDKITFYAPLGSYADKAERLKKTMYFLAEYLQYLRDPAILDKLANLAKADLASLMVAEFPELQGVMGSYYARAAGVDDDIATAIPQQYWVLGDELAERGAKRREWTPLGKLLSLSERLSDLVSLFAVGVKVTGSEDPYALRRSAVTLARLLVVEESSFSFKDFFASNRYLYEPFGIKGSAAENELCKRLIEFLNTRTRSVLKNLVVRAKGSELKLVKVMLPSLVETVLFVDDWNPYRSYRLLCVVMELLAEKAEQLRAVFWAYKRIVKLFAGGKRDDLLQKVLGKEDSALAEYLQQSLSELSDDDTEKKLWQVQLDIEKNAKSMMNDFMRAFQNQHNYVAPLNAFFDNVMVNVDDAELRERRLALLELVKRSLKQFLAWDKLSWPEDVK